MWDVTEEALYFLGNIGKKVYRFHPGTGVTTSWDVPEVITALALREQGGAFISRIWIDESVMVTIESHRGLPKPYDHSVY